MKLKHSISALIIVVAVSRIFLLLSNAMAEKICDKSNLFCVEQSCEIPLDSVRRAVVSAYGFFEKLGYKGKYRVEIEIAPEVTIAWNDGNCQMHDRVLGKYVEAENKIYLTCLNEEWLVEENDFLLPMMPELYETIIAHEMIHFLVNRNSNRKVNAVLSEYIACSGQFDMLPDHMILALVQKYQVNAFETHQICEIAMMLSPCLFCLKSYLHYKKTKGAWVKEIIENRWRAPLITPVP